jgi:hypothetical protein
MGGSDLSSVLIAQLPKYLDMRKNIRTSPSTVSWSILLMLIGGVSCSEPEVVGTQEPLTASLRQEGELRVLTLSQSLNSLSTHNTGVSILAADLELGGADSDLMHVTDVAALPNGDFAILDRLATTVRIFSPGGEQIKTLGKKGPGPMEFERVKAVAAMGDQLVVWDRNGSKEFTVFDTAGTVLGTTPVTIEGDWMALQLRGVQHSYDPPWSQPLEDLTRRLGSLGTNHFVFQIQPDEMLKGWRGEPFPFDAPPVYLVRFDAAARVVDTVATSVAPPNVLRSDVPRGPDIYPHFNQPIFSPRPVWAATDHWIAIGHGDSSAVEVRDLAGTLLLRVEWPRDERGIGDEDRLQHADVRMQEEVFKAGRDHEREYFSSFAERRRARQQIAFELWPFSDRRPQVTAAYGAGDCLWLAGFDPGDAPSGESLTWTAINVATGRIAAVVRIPRNASRVRDFSPTAIFSSYLDTDGVWRLERYPVPKADCGGPVV